MDAKAACSLGDKVYVIGTTGELENSIRVLHNAGASIASLELEWEVIQVPRALVSFRTELAFVPLNSQQIVIFSGHGKVTTFDTITCEFEKVIEVENSSLKCPTNRSAIVC